MYLNIHLVISIYNIIADFNTPPTDLHPPPSLGLSYNFRILCSERRCGASGLPAISLQSLQLRHLLSLPGWPCQAWTLCCFHTILEVWETLSGCVYYLHTLCCHFSLGSCCLLRGIASKRGLSPSYSERSPAYYLISLNLIFSICTLGRALSKY